MTPEAKAELVRLFEAAAALGDPVAPPPGTRVKVRTNLVGTSRDLVLDFESFFEGKVSVISSPEKVRVELGSADGVPIDRPTLLDADPVDLRIVELPDNCPPFEDWLRLGPITPAKISGVKFVARFKITAEDLEKAR